MTKTRPTVADFAPRMTHSDGDIISNSLAFMRVHLDMEMAYLSEFVGDKLVFRVVDAPEFEDVISVGDTMSVSETYCQHIIEGRLPELIPDTNDVPFAQSFAITKSFPIRSYISIPVRRCDGTAYGMFCCLSRKPRPSLNMRDHEVMRAFASFSADQVNLKLVSAHQTQAKLAAIEEILRTSAFEIVLQPILRLQDQRIAGYEALCRFSALPYRPPNLWFDDAADVGLQAKLELHVIDVALAFLPQLPHDCYLSVNISPATLATGKMTPLVEAAGGARIVIEITEHAAIEDAEILLMEIDRLRELGARIAIDDAGAGYSGLQQIIRLRPDIIKLDISLTQDVDKDLARRSLASAMVQFARDTNAHVVAEGIETEAELRTLRMLGVELGQGYHLGRPALAAIVLGSTKKRMI